jgi:diguanylate cyclase (GGDEF)-like protein
MSETMVFDGPLVAEESPVLARTRSPEPKGCLVKIYPAGGDNGVIHLPQHRFSIGRGPGCDLNLMDSAISRQHAAVEPKDERFYVADLGSTNGTYVNDHRIDVRPLAAGDYIRVGSHVIKFLPSDHIEAKYHAALYAMVVTDGLTGVYNKRFFLDAVERELVRAQRHQRVFAVAIFDIDHFKQVNDTYGHLAGDAVLQELCARLRSTIRRDEYFARYGGEEFAVLLPETTRAEARGFAERLRGVVANQPIEFGPIKIPVTISIGLVQCTGQWRGTALELIELADRKLYEAKLAGRNRVAD